MMTAASTLPSGVEIRADAPIPTWFKVGGGAAALAHPADERDLRACLERDPGLRVLGDGANLLVDDDGVPGLVVRLTGAGFTDESHDAPAGLLRLGAGVALMPLLNRLARLGLAGLETLAGIPASVGGAVVMNAGGRFGQVADALARVHAMTRDGRRVTLERGHIDFAYRHSGLADLIVLGAEFRVTPEDPARVRERLKEMMRYKTLSQPMAANSAGCCFRNPTLTNDVADRAGPIGERGQRVSAGLLIDRAGCKGLRVGGAEVSGVHANFLTTHPGAMARDVIGLMALVRRRVRESFGVVLEPEVVIWSRRPVFADEGGA